MTYRQPKKHFVPAFMFPLLLASQGHTQTFTTTGSMNFARSSHQATLLSDGRVLVSGGANASANAIPEAEVFSPGTGTWAVTGSNVTSRFEHTATLLQDGRVLVVGGVSANTSCSSNATAET